MVFKQLSRKVNLLVLGNSTSSNNTTPHVVPSNATAANVTTQNVTSSNNTAEESKPQESKKLQSISVKAEKSFSFRKRRSLDEEEESDGVKKMAARGDHSQMKMPPIRREANEGRPPFLLLSGLISLIFL